ncbi:MAG: hypothetical protein ABL958_19245 [Bdellovibrionia bacterium]
MKALYVLLITLSLLGTSHARAGVFCQTEQPVKATLKLAEPKNSRAYTLVLETALAKTVFGAIPVKHEPGIVYNKTTYSIWGSTGIFGTLVLSSKQFIGRGGCGRGSCDNGLTSLTAVLDYNGAQTKFICQNL